MLLTLESLKLGKLGCIFFEKMSLCELMGPNALECFKYEKSPMDSLQSYEAPWFLWNMHPRFQF